MILVFLVDDDSSTEWLTKTKFVAITNERKPLINMIKAIFVIFHFSSEKSLGFYSSFRFQNDFLSFWTVEKLFCI